MVSGISSNGGGFGNYEFRSLTQAETGSAARAQKQVGLAPPTSVSAAEPDEGSAGVDRIASVVANALVSRIYDAAGLSRSLTQKQHIQAGEIDTRR